MSEIPYAAIRSCLRGEKMSKKKRPAPLQNDQELPEMPGPDEVGQAAHNLLLAERGLIEAETALASARKALVKIMKAHGRSAIKIEGRQFKRRFYESKETVVISRA